MRLKRVKIFGFKTFADKTELNIEGNLIAIIGPNGCGKSNIVDSILWALGEQNVRNLRAQTSQDVIFNGTRRRKPLGYAEVSLFFDNEDRQLHPEFSEIVVTRRVVRSGEGTYQINRRNCRLKDILDLFADSGLGRAGYSIVGQKEIDAALAASPLERRAWIDEAAGVQKYKARRQESLRRLASVAEHLQRVDDLICELHNQLGPLREEAEVAERYKEIQQSLRQLETGILSIEIAKVIEQLTEVEAKHKELTLQSQEKESKLLECEAKAREAQKELANIETLIEKTREESQQIAMEHERLRAAIENINQKQESVDQLELTLQQESETSLQRRQELQLDLERLQTEVAERSQVIQQLRQTSEDAAAKRNQFKTTLGELDQRIEVAKKIRAERLRIEAENAHRHERAKQLELEIEIVSKDLPSYQVHADELHQELTNVDQAIKQHRSSLEELQNNLRELKRKEEELGQQLRKFLSTQASLEGQKRGIEATVESYEGLGQGTKSVLEAVKKGTLEGSYLPVTQAIEVTQELVLAIETALGGAANDLIVPNESYAKRAIEFLKKNRLGRVTFQPISLMRPVSRSASIQDILKRGGVIGLASDLVRCDAEVRPVIESLLGRVVITEDLDSSLLLAKTTGWNRMVTLTGEVTHSSGAVTGGQSGRQNHGILQRKVDLKRITEQILELEKNRLELEQDIQKLREQEKQTQEQIETHRKDLTEKEQLSREKHRLHTEAKQKTQSTESQIQKLEAERQKIVKPLDLPVIEEELEEIEVKRESTLVQYTEANLEMERGEGVRKNAEAQLSQSQTQLQEVLRRCESISTSELDREVRLQQLHQQRDQLREDISRFQQGLDQAKEASEKAQAHLQILMQQKDGSRQEASMIEEHLGLTRQNLQSILQDLHRVELSRAKFDTQRAAIIQRLLEEYGMTQQEALELAEGVEPPQNAQLLVNQHRRELKSMGDVNLGAIDAYQRVNERYSELAYQKEDILSAKKEIESGIKELDEITRERFLDTFIQVQLAFAENMGTLFGGGEGVLKLLESDDLGESGVEVEVTLPGKKRQKLELLSGGERALSACAFLFALLRTKPSPLVVLDEVDAPLDGRNVERFIELLKGFCERTQFLVITHNPVTIEAATSWFGITMQEPGVSTLVPYKAPQVVGV